MAPRRRQWVRQAEWGQRVAEILVHGLVAWEGEATQCSVFFVMASEAKKR